MIIAAVNGFHRNTFNARCLMANLRNPDAIFDGLTGVFATVSPLGRRTDAREQVPFRFSEELPHRQLFRKEMRPQKRQIVVPEVYVYKTSFELENTHQLTTLAPSLHLPLEVRPEKERSPKIVHGTLYHPHSFSLPSAIPTRLATGLPSHRTQPVRRPKYKVVVQADASAPFPTREETPQDP
jgi:hypothetical protein